MRQIFGEITYKPMKKEELSVLQLGKFWPVRGGIEKVMYEFATGLSQRGVHCDMLTAACQGAGGITTLKGGARLITCRTWCKVAATMIAPSMITQLRSRIHDYSVVHVHHPDPMAALALRLSGYKGKVVLHWHSDIVKQKRFLKLYIPLQRWLLRRADLIVGTTPAYISGSPYLHSVRHKTTSLPIGIEPIKPDFEGAERIRRQYGGRRIVFALGRLVPYKGFDYLIRAAQYLGNNYVILIGGVGPLEDYLYQQIAACKVAGRVRLLGYVPDSLLPAFYSASSLFCLSSVQKTEAFGIVQLEAMSCGRPVVATNISGSGTSWVNAHGVSGLNVDPCDPEQLADAILFLTRDEATYKHYSEQARLRYENVFTKEKMIDKLLDIYASL